MRTTRNALAVSSLLSLILCAACSRSQTAQAHVITADDAPAVAVAKASTADLSHAMVLTAEFKPFQEVDVMAKVSGYVKKINVDVGDRVQAGQLLATLEIPEMADDILKAQASVAHSTAEVQRARDEIARAESAYQMAHLTYTRLADVAKQKPGLIAQQEIDDAHSKDLVAEAQVAAAKSNLAAAQQDVSVNQAEQGRTKTLYDYTRVVAPFAGVVTMRYANNGSMIQAGTNSQTQAMPVVRISENSLLRLILPVPESAVPTVHIGQQVEVHVPTLHRSFPGKVARFSDKLQTSTRTMDTEVDVPNASLVLIPGMYAEVNLTTAKSGESVVVPVPAVDLDTEAESDNAAKHGKVMVVTADNRLEIHPVVIGMETANRVAIQSGVRSGDLVVIGNRSGLQPGQTVKPKLTDMGAK